MGYDRYPRGTNQQDDYHDRGQAQDYISGERYSYPPGYRDDDRGYQNRDRSGGRGYDDRSQRGGYFGESRGGGFYRDRQGSGQNRGQSPYGRDDDHHDRYGSDDDYYYRHEARGRDDRSHRDRGVQRPIYGGQQQQQQHRDYGRAPQGYDYQDRGFMARAGDEVRSWFGDEEAERRREADSRYDERDYARHGASRHDSDYHGWRSNQIAAFDRDYEEFRHENRSRFEQEFSAWRTSRQSQRDLLNQIREHAEVVGSDGTHVGTVDKIRGDRIVLTKNDADAGGQHHSIPSRWLHNVEADKVTLSKTAEEARQHWRTEEQNQATYGFGDSRQGGGSQGNDDRDRDRGAGTNLNRSFPGTY